MIFSDWRFGGVPFFQSARLACIAPAQHSVHPTGGSRRVFRQVAWLQAGSGKTALPRPTHPRVTLTVGQKAFPNTMKASDNRHKNRWKKLAISFLFTVLILSCTFLKQSSNQNGSEFPADPLVDRSFVTGQPCEAPCWYGLRLGESTLDDIRKTLPELPFVDNSRIREQPTGEFGPNEKSFVVRCTYSTEADLCAELTTSKDGKLSKIIIIVAYELTLQRAIEYLGVPTFYNVSPSPNKDLCYVEAFWPERDIVAAFNDSPRDRLCTRTGNEKIDLNSQILSLVYTDISVQDQQKYEGLPWPNSVP